MYKGTGVVLTMDGDWGVSEVMVRDGNFKYFQSSMGCSSN